MEFALTEREALDDLMTNFATNSENCMLCTIRQWYLDTPDSIYPSITFVVTITTYLSGMQRRVDRDFGGDRVVLGR